MALLLVVVDHATVAIRCVVSSSGGHSSSGGAAVVVVVCWRWRRSHRAHFCYQQGRVMGTERVAGENSLVALNFEVEIVIRVSENRSCLVAKNKSE